MHGNTKNSKDCDAGGRTLQHNQQIYIADSVQESSFFKSRTDVEVRGSR